MVKYKNYDEAMPVLRQWLTTQPHLPIIEDMPLKAFIVFCDGDLEEAKLLIDKQYSFRTNNPQIFGNRDAESDSFKKLNEILDITILPDSTPDNHRVIVYRIRDPDTTNYNYAEQVRLVSAYFDTFLRVQSPEVTPDGAYIIMDFKEFTMQHLTKIDLSAVRVLSKFFEDFISVKLPRSHLINCSTFISKLLAIARTFLAEKTMKKFIIHDKDPEELFDYIPKDILPIDINGTKGNLLEIKKANIELLKNNRDYLINKKYWFVDETKRPPNSRKPQFDQMQGNFRTLSVD